MRRGQAFDTFKLMIAAVVAVAILGILLGILGTISVPGAGFDDTVKSLLQRAYSTPGVTTVSTGDVTFSEGSLYPGDAFKRYTDGTTGVNFQCSAAELCISKPTGLNLVEKIELGDTLDIKTNFKSKIYVVCNLGTNGLCCVGVGVSISQACCASPQPTGPNAPEC